VTITTPEISQPRRHARTTTQLNLHKKASYLSGNGRFPAPQIDARRSVSRFSNTAEIAIPVEGVQWFAGIDVVWTAVPHHTDSDGVVSFCAFSPVSFEMRLAPIMANIRKLH
jgi:hypothetical protein